MQRSDKLMHLFSRFECYTPFSRICTHINEEIVVNCHTSHAIVVNHARPPVCRWLGSTKLGENLTSAAVVEEDFHLTCDPNCVSIYRAR